MGNTPFGNDAAKIDRYRAFWERADVNRPLVGFTQIGWFPLEEFESCRNWPMNSQLQPDMIDPQAFMADHVRLLREGETMDDDLIRGAGPTQVAVPFLPGMLGCKLRVLPGNVLGEEQQLSWQEALDTRLCEDNPWYRKYFEFADQLVATADGLFPVSHGAEIGPTDLHAALRGHNQSILDLVDEPERTAELLHHVGILFRQLTDELWNRLPLFHGGYFDGQYSLWAPGPIARLQEDASGVYSPALFRKHVQPVDRALAEHFTCGFMHLHSTSLFLLEAFLEIEALGCFEINNDASGPPVAELVPFFQSVQSAGRSLLIRGSFEPDELRLLMDSLEPRGLFLLIMIKDAAETDVLRPVVGL